MKKNNKNKIKIFRINRNSDKDKFALFFYVVQGIKDKKGKLQVPGVEANVIPKGCTDSPKSKILKY
jgi:hypothetical protein